MKDKCTVYNKSAGHVVYRLPELGLRRQFYPREAKKDISAEIYDFILSLSMLKLFAEIVIVHAHTHRTSRKI